ARRGDAKRRSIAARAGRVRPTLRRGGACLRSPGSVQCLAETLRARLPAVEDVGRCEQVVGAADQALAGHRADVARVLAVVAVVAEHEIVPGRHRKWPEVAPRARQELHAAGIAADAFGRVEGAGGSATG